VYSNDKLREEITEMKILNRQQLLDMVDGTAIFSAGGGGAPELGYGIVEKLVNDGYEVRLIEPNEVPEDAIVANFACVGATTSVGYDSQAAVKTLKILEEYIGKEVFAVIPVELGGFNTLVAVDVAARRGVPVVDADGAGRAVPEVHLKVYTIDEIPLAPMAIADIRAKNVVIVKETADSKSAERIARVLATEWSHTAYTARRILTGTQVKYSPIQKSLSRAIKIGEILRTSKNPIKSILAETEGYKLFQGRVVQISKETIGGFTWISVSIRGENEFEGSTFNFKAKNEVLIAYRNGKLVAMAPDIITPVRSENGKCVTAERIREGDSIAVLGLKAPEKWRTSKGIELWMEMLRRSGVTENYVPIEELASS